MAPGRITSDVLATGYAALLRINAVQLARAAIAPPVSGTGAPPVSPPRASDPATPSSRDAGRLLDIVV